MISCPNCGKSVADDAVHCGHCGHKIEPATNQKTMMGFSLSPEDLQKAIAEAGQQRAAQSVVPAEPSEQVDELARTEILPSISGNPALSDTLDPDSDMPGTGPQAGFGAPFSADSSSGFAGMEPKSDVASGFGASPSVHDPFSQQQPVAAPLQQSVTPMQQPGAMANLAGGGDGTGESFIEKNKKLLIIGGAVFAVLFGCCILSTIYSFFFS